jgi:WD40 repeat protein
MQALTLPEKDVIYLSASPDGRWLATGVEDKGPGPSVWDVRSGKRVKAWSSGHGEVEFSRDGRWLVTTTGRFGPQGTSCSSWRVGTWEMASQVRLNSSSSSGAALALSPDSRMVAVTSTMTAIRLMRLDTFEEIATLTAPDTQLIAKMVFNPDSTRLAAAAGKTIYVWDLPAVRQCLRELDLDWQGPDYPPREESPPWRIEVDPGKARP